MRLDADVGPVLGFGGVPLVLELLHKAIKFEFGSDLLAGISIVTVYFSSSRS